jgi:hypothetical protein
MTEEQIKQHAKRKEHDVTYPKLPKYIRDKKTIDSTLKQHIDTAFLTRVRRYEKNKEYQETNRV